MGRLAGKRAIVIGAGQMAGVTVGTGRATTIKFLQEGASVFAVDRHPESAQETLEMSGADLSNSATFRADVTQSDTLRLAIEAAVEKWGGFDILFYNVGGSVAGGDTDLENMTDDILANVNNINLRGAVMAAKYAVPVLRRQRSGVILNLASVTAIETTRPNVAYKLAKAGLVAFTQQLAIQNAGYGIRVNAISPGIIDTPMAVDQRARLYGRSREELAAERDREVPLNGRQGNGWDIANGAVFLASDEASFITGINLPIDGGMLARIGY